MKTSVPILWPSRSTPAASGGLRLAIGPRDEVGAWIHGALPAGAALRDLFIIAVSEANQQAFVAPLLGQEGFLQEPGEVAAFGVHTSTLFDLFDGRFLVHAAAGDLLSNVALLERAAAPELPAAGDAPGDGLIAAYDHAFHGRSFEAVEAFRAAFAEKRVEEELDAAHRYNAACAASRAAAAPQGKRAGELRELALSWLEADLRRRAEVHTSGSFAFAASDEDERRQLVRDELFRAHVRHLRADPDLAGLPIPELLHKLL